MCLIVFAWNPESERPLVLSANRDEFYPRPSAPLNQWPDAPDIFAGRDLEGGGTWLGVTRSGRFAALTNIRDLHQPQRPRTRGALTRDFLSSTQSIAEYLQRVSDECEQYMGFNLLLGDGRELWHFNSQHRQARKLPAGVYGLSNADLDTPWPKLTHRREALRQVVPEATRETLWRVLADTQRANDDELPATGLGLDGERLLSSAFIATQSYGTRATTAVVMNRAGELEISERCFGPHGVVLSETTLRNH